MVAQGELFNAPTPLFQGLLYQPDFLTLAEECALLNAVATLPLHEAKFHEYFAKRRAAHVNVVSTGPDSSGISPPSTGRP